MSSLKLANSFLNDPLTTRIMTSEGNLGLFIVSRPMGLKFVRPNHLMAVILAPEKSTLNERKPHTVG